MSRGSPSTVGKRCAPRSSRPAAALHASFVVDERFGLNRTTPRTFVLDRVKALALAAALGGPLLAAVPAIFAQGGRSAWLLCWIAVAGHTLIVQCIAPTWILPLFNTFTPLGEGALRERIERYAASVGFSLDNIYLMDGSSRSSRSNAFFPGFGKRRRIALFDTLVARLTAGELVAVLAHEIGHFTKRHALKGAAVSIAHAGAVLWILSQLSVVPGLCEAFFVERASVHAGLALFGVLFTPAASVVAAALSAWSRKNKYEADRFAAETTAAPEELVGALKKPAAQNLSHLNPHPWLVALHRSHPPLRRRIAAISAGRG